MHKKSYFATSLLLGVVGAGLLIAGVVGTGLFIAGVIGPRSLVAVAPDVEPYTPKIDPASDQWKEAQKRIQVPAGFTVDLWAAEPLLANPVCFAIDEKNRFYVAEDFRLHDGVTDIRSHMDWLDDDLACRTVEDRTAMLKHKLGDKVKEYGVQHDRIRLIEDTTGAGKADKAEVWADGFHDIPDGIGAGLVTRNGDVWYTCIPDLWKMRDTTGMGKADQRELLHHGFGVHVGFLGHDLHGLRFGPDGKLYFSIGDRGINIKDAEKPLFLPDTGSVMRCNPDGTELEIYAMGLRNPQELAFDECGNLFTVDNNSDAGDKVRCVYVVEGGDSGWRIGYQFGTATGVRGPWMAEKMDDPQWDGQAEFLVPPVANLANGPSGLTCYPGLGLPERYNEHFFLCDFRGSSGGSGVRSFACKPKGATFQMVDEHQFIWSVLATDVDFGMDCAIYVSDWVEGWEKPNKGRIWKITYPELAKEADVQEVKKIMAEGFDKRTTPELVALLQHKDMRVRQSAQFALAAKGGEAIPAFAGIALEGKNRLSRFHAIWGLGQIGRKDSAAYQALLPLLKDADPEVRAQTAKTLGDGRFGAGPPFVALLKDPEPRVRFFVAQGLARLGDKKSVPAVLDMLRDNADKDAYLRHAGVMALADSGAKDAWMTAADDPSPAVRMAVLLALRRTNDADVARYLNDSDPKLVVEAARAINDVPIEGAAPKLAALVRQSGLSLPLGYRVLNANFRLGRKENAEAVAAFAGRADAEEELRIEALKELADWTKPAGRDRVIGVWRPLEPRPPELAADAFRAVLGGVFNGSDKVRKEAVDTAVKLGVKEVGPVLLETARDAKRPARMRAESLRALASLKDSRLDAAVKTALDDAEPLVRSEGRRLLAQTKPAEALPLLTKAVESGEIIERQGAYAVLGELKTPGVDDLLAKQLDELLEKKPPPEIALDLLEAAGKHPAKEIKERLTRYEAARPKGDALAPYREALVGGDADNGRRLFFYKQELSCLRCHKVNGEGGEVGPEMKGIGTRQKRDYLLESIVDPNKQIAKGYDSVLLVLNNGQTRTGVLKGEDAKEIRLMTAEGKLVTVAKDEVDERHPGKSAMPEDVIKKLSKSELRDLVEFLAGLKEKQ
jgi:quinoprotein glucose dehydrogenase